MKNSVYSILIVFAIIMVSCDNPEKDYELAKKENTIESYELFIKKYPESHLSMEAKDSLHYLELVKAKSTNTAESYQNLMEQYQNTYLFDSALFYLNRIVFRKARISNSITEYSRYLAFAKKYEINENINTVTFIIDSLRYDSIVNLGTNNAFKEFIASFPESQFVDQAKSSIYDNLITGKIVDYSELTDYLTKNSCLQLVKIPSKTMKEGVSGYSFELVSNSYGAFQFEKVFSKAIINKDGSFSFKLKNIPKGQYLLAIQELDITSSKRFNFKGSFFISDIVFNSACKDFKYTIVTLSGQSSGKVIIINIPSNQSDIYLGGLILCSFKGDMDFYAGPGGGYLHF